MLFKEAKEILNNKGYKLVEYYTEPPEGMDLEPYAIKAKKCADEEMNSAVESVKEGLKEKYPDVRVYSDDVISNEDFDYENLKYGVGQYTESFICKLKFEVPLKYLNLTEEGAMADDFRKLMKAMEIFFDDAMKFNDSEIVFDYIEDIDLDTTQKTKFGTMIVTGEYKYKILED